MQTLWTGLATVGLILLTTPQAPAHAGHLFPEKTYQRHWCDQFHGNPEIRLEDGTRADCITHNYAVEFDFAPKWAECLGQALHYADLTGKRPACVLIIEQPRDWRHFKKLRRFARRRSVKIWYMRPQQITTNQ